MSTSAADAKKNLRSVRNFLQADGALLSSARLKDDSIFLIFGAAASGARAYGETTRADQEHVVSRLESAHALAMLARPPLATRKKRAYRRRQRDGAIVLGCEVIEHDFAAALLASRRLDERQALRRDQLARAAEEILREFTRRWLAHNQ